MLPSLIEFIGHIQSEMNFVLKHSEGLEYDSLVENEVLSRAFIRSLEIVGEATKHLPDDLRIAYPAVDWKGLAGLRDILIYQYWGVDYQVLWNIIQDDIPYSKVWIDVIIEREKEKISKK